MQLTKTDTQVCREGSPHEEILWHTRFLFPVAAHGKLIRRTILKMRISFLEF